MKELTTYQRRALSRLSIEETPQIAFRIGIRISTMRLLERYGYAERKGHSAGHRYADKVPRWAESFHVLWQITEEGKQYLENK